MLGINGGAQRRPLHAVVRRHLPSPELRANCQPW